MKFNLTIEKGKTKVRYGLNEEHTIQVSMTREFFAKIMMDYVTKYQRPVDIRDVSGELWNDLDIKFSELRK